MLEACCISLYPRRMRLVLFMACFYCSFAFAEEEKVVNIYTWADYIPLELIRDFEDEYGIRVNYNTYSNDYILIAKLLAGNTGFDVVGLAGVDVQRFLPIDVFQKTDKSKLTNLDNRETKLYDIAHFFDPGNEYAQIYTWGSTGVAYNVDMVLERMPDAPVDSSAMIFDPEIISQFEDCGVSFLDDAATVIRLAMKYLGYDIDERSDEALAEVETLLKKVRPFIRYFSSSRVGIDLPAGEICLAMAWSGDTAYAQANAVKAGQGVQLDYRVPKEGTNLWVDCMLLAKDSPHPANAHLFLDYLMRPEVAAQVSNVYYYASANHASLPLVQPHIRNNEIVFHSDEMMKRVHPRRTYNLKEHRKINRMWARVKAGID